MPSRTPSPARSPSRGRSRTHTPLSDHRSVSPRRTRSPVNRRGSYDDRARSRTRSRSPVRDPIRSRSRSAAHRARSYTRSRSRSTTPPMPRSSKVRIPSSPKYPFMHACMHPPEPHTDLCFLSYPDCSRKTHKEHPPRTSPRDLLKLRNSHQHRNAHEPIFQHQPRHRLRRLRLAQRR